MLLTNLIGRIVGEPSNRLRFHQYDDNPLNLIWLIPAEGTYSKTNMCLVYMRPGSCQGRFYFAKNP